MTDAATDGDRPRWRLAAPVHVGAARLWPIERVVLRFVVHDGHAWCSGALEPWALLMDDGTGLHAIDAAGRPIPLDRLRALVPGLDAAVLAQSAAKQ